MSLSSTTNRNDYIGSDSTAVYPYTFKIFQSSDLRVVKRNLSDVEFILTLNVDYTVSGVQSATGGNITLLAGNLPTDYALTVRRVVELKQETDIRNQGDFLPETHEDQFDRHVMADQQIQDEVDRSVKNPETVSASDFDPTLPTDIQTPERALVTNATGTGWALGLVTVTDSERIFNSAPFSELNDLAVADPTTQRWGWATDMKQLLFYTADLTVGTLGWVTVAG